MEQRLLGKTKLPVTILGFGAAQVGILPTPYEQAEKLLNDVIDSGINLIDTATAYGRSEEFIGKAISHRRNEFILVSKCGPHVLDTDGPAWTAKCLRDNIDRSLRLMKTDHLDVLLLHTCVWESINKDEIIDTLINIKQKGQTSFIGYSGDNADALTALDTGVMDCLEISVNICDQQSIEKVLPMAKKLDIGVFTKRSVANTCWRQGSNTLGHYAQAVVPYCQRLQKMGLTAEAVGFDGSMTEMALRFAAYQTGVTCAIIGGRDMTHIRENIEMVGKGPLSKEVDKAIKDLWRECDNGSWIGQP